LTKTFPPEISQKRNIPPQDKVPHSIGKVLRYQLSVSCISPRSISGRFPPKSQSFFLVLTSPCWNSKFSKKFTHSKYHSIEERRMQLGSLWISFDSTTLDSREIWLLRSSFTLCTFANLPGDQINFAYPSRSLSNFLWSLRYETKRLRTLFEVLDSSLYRSFIKALEDEVSKKDDQLKFRGGIFLWSFASHVIFFQEEAEEIHKNLARKISPHAPKLKKTSSFQQFPQIVVEFERLQKISSHLLGIFVKNWLWKNFSFCIRRKKSWLKVSCYWKIITPE